jgi:hypothetical protein
MPVNLERMMPEIVRTSTKLVLFSQKMILFKEQKIIKSVICLTFINNAKLHVKNSGWWVQIS